MTKTVENQINTRALVMDMLLEVTQNQAYSHIVIREVLNKYNYLSNQEKSFMKRLFEGTLERMIEIDYFLNLYSKVKVSKMKPVIRTIMRMSVYQIMYMDAVPDAAACNEAVKLAQKKGFATLKGFVNGVLRNIVRNKDALSYPDKEKNAVSYLSVKYSMPEWIVELWLKQLGIERTEQVLAGLLAEHPVTVRFRNCDAGYIEQVRKIVEKQGGALKQHPYLPYAYHIEKTDDLTKLPGFQEGNFVIQDVSSMLAVEVLGVKPGMQVLDICAAPGGKSMLAADFLQKEGLVEARDISTNKVALMQENFDRCRIENAKAVVWDALDFDEAWKEKADIVIADIPCSGLGIIGKKRDIKYKMNEEAVKSIEALQTQILEKAVAYVKPGGKLLFSTCTINQEENEAHVALLQEKYHMTPVSLNERLPEALHNDTTQKGYLQLLPGVHETDGFFISVFCKKEKG